MEKETCEDLGEAPSQACSLPVLEPSMQESQSNVKFVQDTSKFWYKPHLSRDQGEEPARPPLPVPRLWGPILQAPSRAWVFNWLLVGALDLRFKSDATQLLSRPSHTHTATTIRVTS